MAGRMFLELEMALRGDTAAGEGAETGCAAALETALPVLGLQPV